MGNLTDLTTSWDGYLKSDVEDLIKSEFAKDKSNIATKYGATYFDQSTMTQYGFASPEDKQTWLDTGDSHLILGQDKFEFSGKVRQLKIISSQSTTLWFTTTSETANIIVGFTSQEKGLTDSSWTEVFEDAIFQVLVDKGNSGEWTAIVDSKKVKNGNFLTVDVRKYLANGSNRVRFIAKGETSEESASLIFNVNVTTMYLSASNFNWSKPFIEGESYSLGGVNIGGALSKTLFINVSSDDYNKTYEVNVGTQTYVTNAYYFNDLMFPETGTGVYYVHMWLDASGVESAHLYYNIMCISQDDVKTAQLVVINDVAQDVVNYSDAELFKYSCYNSGSTSAEPNIIVKIGDRELANEHLSDVITNVPHSFSMSLEVESEASELELSVQAIYGNTYNAIVTVDNSASYPAKQGASFLFNAVNRSNSQSNKTSIINEANNTEYEATWTNIDFTDGIDGYTTDNAGRKCLCIPASCSVDIPYNPFSVVSSKTIEIAFKASNVADYNDNIITIAKDSGDSFVGIKIKPTNVVAYSNLLKDSAKQSYNIKDDEFVHLIISLTKDYRTTFGNLAKIYVNGEVRCEFEYSSSDTWTHDANIILGSPSADLYVYKMRVYDSGCDWFDAVQNYINCLPSIQEKSTVYDKVMSTVDDSYQIDYDAVVNSGYNTMVVEMLNGATLPDKTHQSGGNCNLSINITNAIEGELDEDFAGLFNGTVLENVPIEGQGTTAMTYFRWNLRSKLPSTYNKRRITAKKNVASSMHSHKMGATRAYNDLHNAVVGMNEANARVAVYQYPVYGFLKELNELGEYSYTFIGLYTVGPDKGDKPTFGYNNSAYKNSVISLEGTDHTPLAVGFDYPWDATKYSYVREAMGAKTASGDVSAAWEVSMAGDYSSDESSDEANIQTMLNAEFRPAYDVVYNSSPFIEGVTEDLATINTDPLTWQKNHNGKEFYTDGVFDLYYYDSAEKIYKSNGINLLTQLSVSTDDISSLTLEEKTSLFIQKRKDYFKANVGSYWNLEDSLFCLAFILIFGATDNFKKNSYPYKFDLLSNGGKWRWRQDDLDTLFDINNQGFAAKSYSILIGDKTSSGSIFRGDDSVFWTLLLDCFMNPDPNDTSIPSVKSMVHNIFDAMSDLSSNGDNTLDRVVGYIRDTFWNFAQAYFPQSAYNIDASWTYEEAWGIYGTSYNNDVHPLQQSLGGHYEAERRWVELRTLFIASYFNYGPFATDHGDDASTGQVSFRAVSQDTVAYSLTPAVDMNPTILIGQSDLSSAGDRIMSGETVDVVVPAMGSNDTHIYIQGADYLESLGDLSNITLSQDNSNLVVKSKRLRDLKVGDETAENVTSNVATLSLGSCPSLERIDARNLASLTGEVSLNGSPRIKEALFAGTSINNLTIPEGSKIDSVSLPSTIQNISLVKVNRLSQDTFLYDSLANVSYLRLENNAQLNGFALLKEAFSTEGSQLKNIRVVGFDYEGDATDLDMLATLANGSYTGIDADGRETTGLPVIEGTLRIDSPVYEDSLDVVKANYPALTIIAEGGYYIRFDDAAVCEICATNWGDGIGITEEQAGAVTDIGTKFKENTLIETFDEFDKFTRVTSLISSAFYGDINLRSITLNSSITSIGISAFNNCSALEVEINLPYLTSLGLGAFYSTGIKSFKADALESIYGDNSSNSTFSTCKNLTTVDLPSIKSIGNFGFNGCTSLRSVNIETVESIGISAFKGCTSLGGNMYLPNLVGALPLGAFLGTAITSFVAPKLTDINGDNATNSAFTDCNELQEVILDSIQTIGRHVFQNRTSLRSIKIDTVEEIGVNAFYNCTSLEIEELNLPNLKTLGSNAFYGVSIKKISNLGSITTLNTGIGDASVLEEIALPDTITSIPANCFKSYSALKSIKMDGVTTMYGDCFMSTTNLQEFVAPNLETVSGANHLRASGITKFIAPKLQNANEWICTYTPNIRLVLLRDITTIASRSFSNNSTYEAFVCLNPTPPTLAWNAFQSTNIESGTGSIYVPDGTTTDADGNTITIVEAYKASTNWSTYAARIFPISQLQTDNPELYAEIEEYL